MIKVIGYKQKLLNILVLYGRNVCTDGAKGLRLEDAAEEIEKLFAKKYLKQTFDK